MLSLALTLPNATDCELGAGRVCIGPGRLEALVRSNFGYVWRLARRLGLGPADADDVAQRVMLVLSRRLPDIAPGSERAFLARTTVHLVSKARRSFWRRRERWTVEDEGPADCGPGPEDLLAQQQARAELDRILERLPNELRVAFVLFEIEGLTQAEIALVLGIAPGTVASRLRRAREKFARLAARRGLLPGWSGRQP